MNIALFYGGDGNEAPISLVSAQEVYIHLSKHYSVYPIHVSAKGWFYTALDNNISPIALNLNTFSLPMPSVTVALQFAFIAMHGTPAEDGKIQSVLDMLQIPYNGCHAEVSAICFNKYLTKLVAQDKGIATAPFTYLSKTNNAQEYNYTQPIVVKPCRSGSNVGISLVKDDASLSQALQLAFAHDHEVLLEEYIHGTEYTTGIYTEQGHVAITAVLHRATNNEIAFGSLASNRNDAKLKVSNYEFYKGNSSEHLQFCQEVYRQFNLRGFVRIDYIEASSNGQFYLLEINTIPGMSKLSIFPKQLQATDGFVSFEAFYRRQVEESLGTHQCVSSSQSITKLTLQH
jgi:D-alanine-D-alanine ligase